MPNLITTAGLQVKTQAELVTEWTANFQSIYGADINLSSDTPDGQMMMLFIQAVLDLEDLLVQIYNSFDPDLAIGGALDMRVAINGIQRQGGTFTRTNLTIVVDRALTLGGLDAAVDDPNGTGYTIQDNAGNKWLLITTQVVAAPGTYVYEFRAQNPGAVLTVPNTINSPVDVILGVISVNNPTTYNVLGEDEESDAALRIRRQKSVSLASQGYLSGLLAALLNINTVSTAIVIENVTGTTDADGVPGHSIWVIVEGGNSIDIANAIYSKRNAGCGMKGSVTHTITQLDGTPFIVAWDVVTPQALHIQFTVTPMDGISSIDTAAMKAALVTKLAPGVYERVNINELSTLVQSIDPNALVVPTVGDGFSTSGGGPFTNTLLPTGKNNQFAVSAPNISITVV